METTSRHRREIRHGARRSEYDPSRKKFSQRDYVRARRGDRTTLPYQHGSPLIPFSIIPKTKTCASLQLWMCLLEGTAEASHTSLHGRAAAGSESLAVVVTSPACAAGGDAKPSTGSWMGWNRESRRNGCSGRGSRQVGRLRCWANLRALTTKRQGQGLEAWPLSQSISHDGLARSQTVPRQSGLVRLSASVSAVHHLRPGRTRQARQGTRHAIDKPSSSRHAQCYRTRGLYGQSLVLHTVTARLMRTTVPTSATDSSAATSAEHWASITRGRPHSLLVQGGSLRDACNVSLSQNLHRDAPWWHRRPLWCVGKPPGNWSA